MLVKCLSCGNVWESRKESVSGLRCSSCNSRKLTRLTLNLSEEEIEKLLFYLVRELKDRDITVKELVEKTISKFSSFTKLEKEIDRLDERYKKTYTEYQNLRESCKQFRDQRNRLKSEVEKLEILKGRISSLQKEEGRLTTEISQLGSIKSKLNNQITHKQIKLTNILAEIGRVTNKIDLLKTAKFLLLQNVGEFLRKDPINFWLFNQTLKGNISKRQIESVTALLSLAE